MLTSTANVARNASAAPLAFLAKSVVSHAGLAFFTALFAVATLATSALIDRPFHYGMAGRLSKLYSVMVPVFLAILLIGAFIRMASVERPASPARHFARKIRGFACDSERLVGMAIMSALLVWFMAGFAFMKESIPALQPFDWDSTFRDWDRMLFGGVDPWRLTFAVFGTPAATTLINAAYHAWVFVIYMTLLAAVFGVLPRRQQLVFLYAFMFTWAIGGVALATIFSSAGPVYFERLGLGGDFEPQMALLRQFNEVSPVWSLTVQEMLWTAYQRNGGDISGISAMPSMHVASSIIVMLLAYRINRGLGHLMLAFTNVMMIGSVHLGWHYAVDGLFGAALALACWYAAERVAALDLAFQRRMLPRVGSD